MRVMHEKPPPDGSPGLRTTHREPPLYPRFMLRMGRTGVTFSRLDIAPDGHVTRVETRPYGDGMAEVELQGLGEAVRNALLQWRFNPEADSSGASRVSCQTTRFNLAE
jgi:TonB-like protein